MPTDDVNCSTFVQCTAQSNSNLEFQPALHNYTMQIESKEKPKYEPKPLATLQEQELHKLLEIERQSRQNSNMDQSQAVCKKIADLLLTLDDPVRLISTVKTLATKRGQIIRTITELVRFSMQQVEKIADEALRIFFVGELKEICDKKIYVEVEYARCAMILVKHNEKGNANLEEAAKIMENVQVETYGSMTKREKLDFIIYQMHIQFLLGDEIKLSIVSKKINPKMLEEEGFHVFKITYYLFQFFLNHKNGAFTDCSANLEKVLQGLKLVQGPTEIAAVDPILVARYPFFLEKQVLAQAILLFKEMEEHSADKIEAIQKLKTQYDELLVNSTHVLPLTESFLSKEITACDIDFKGLSAFPVFSAAFPDAETLMRVTQNQLVKKNLAIVAKYFKNVKLVRLAQILRINLDTVEDCLCDLIVNQLVKAKIDRPAGVVDFSIPEVSNDNDMVDNWVENINQIVDIVDLACERIEHEEVVAK